MTNPFTLSLQVEFHGLSGLVKFDPAGVRSNFTVDVVSLVDAGLVPLGRWTTKDGFTASGADNRTRIVPSIKNQNLIVTTLTVSTAPDRAASCVNLAGSLM